LARWKVAAGAGLGECQEQAKVLHQPGKLNRHALWFEGVSGGDTWVAIMGLARARSKPKFHTSPVSFLCVS
jgi:hypothetical protein